MSHLSDFEPINTTLAHNEDKNESSIIRRIHFV